MLTCHPHSHWCRARTVQHMRANVCASASHNKWGVHVSTPADVTDNFVLACITSRLARVAAALARQCLLTALALVQSTLVCMTLSAPTKPKATVRGPHSRGWCPRAWQVQARPLPLAAVRGQEPGFAFARLASAQARGRCRCGFCPLAAAVTRPLWHTHTMPPATLVLGSGVGLLFCALSARAGGADAGLSIALQLPRSGVHLRALGLHILPPATVRGQAPLWRAWHRRRRGKCRCGHCPWSNP
jgi:hypothetical protein